MEVEVGEGRSIDFIAEFADGRKLVTQEVNQDAVVTDRFALNDLGVCKFSDDNFLKFLDAKAGETYTLFINNFDSKNGFSILFDGTGELEFLSDCIDDKNLLSMQLLEIYPNPATNILNVSLFSANNDPVNLELLTLSGQLVTELKHKGAPGNMNIPVDISSLSAGTYLLRIKNNSNNLVEKFVKN
jgi:hypothetical protein